MKDKESRQVKFHNLFQKNWKTMRERFSWFGGAMSRRSARKIARDLARQGKTAQTR